MAGCVPGAIFGNHAATGGRRYEAREKKLYAKALVKYESTESNFFSIRNVRRLEEVKTPGGVLLKEACFLEKVLCGGNLRLVACKVRQFIDCSGASSLIGVKAPGEVTLSGEKIVIRKADWLIFNDQRSVMGTVKVLFNGNDRKEVSITDTKIEQLVFVNKGAWSFKLPPSSGKKINFSTKFGGVKITIRNCEISKLVFR